ncbi:unnamed protein product [Candida verbasci]|uniref:Altered inheritance of mitochondria protein 32 n=1 Tax=Candida verbasci TaxID=1227364 RepID=A0A9W4TRJ9_9ASCO|nr:unnamed protein product [Candida verbasci]
MNRLLLHKRYYSIPWKLIDNVTKLDRARACSCIKFPQDAPIDLSGDLNYTSAIPSKHIMCLTTKDNKMEEFNSKIEDWKGTLAFEMQKFKKLYQDQRVSISSIVFENHQKILKRFSLKEGSDQQLVFLYPDNIAIRFNLRNTYEFIIKYLYKEQIQDVYNPFKPQIKEKKLNISIDINSIDSNLFQEFEIGKDLVLTCGHAKRDIRCGIMGPILQNEFTSRLKKDYINSVYNGQITHIGGHKYAGNVLYYPKETSSPKDFIWYGRVFPEDVDDIIKETVVNKKIIKELFRGPIGNYMKH